MTEYKFYSSFLMLCDCKSYINSLTINSYISVQLKVNDYSIKYLKNYKERPTEYDILLHDLYNDEYWVFNKKENDKYDNILKYVISYVESNNKIFRLCFIEMKHYLLNKLNNTNVVLFSKLFSDYYEETTKDKIFINCYYDKFIEMLKKVDENTLIGNYILQNHEKFFDEMFHLYCITHFNKEKITDANYIIPCINNLLK